MNRASFLKSLFAPLLIPFVGSRESAIERLELDYCEASNALWDYRERLGFIPGARVRAQSRFTKQALEGVIAPYGEQWATVDGMHVPVRLDKGYTQPWMMSQLTIIRNA
jgi:hypothetical protein